MCPFKLWNTVLKTIFLNNQEVYPTYSTIVNKAKIILSKHNIQINYQTDHRCGNRSRIIEVEKVFSKINTNVSSLPKFEERKQCVFLSFHVPVFSEIYNLRTDKWHSPLAILILHLKFFYMEILKYFNDIWDISISLHRINQ